MALSDTDRAEIRKLNSGRGRRAIIDTLLDDAEDYVAHIAALEAERDGFTHQVAELTANLKRCTLASRESERRVAALEQVVRTAAVVMRAVVVTGKDSGVTEFLEHPEVAAVLPKPNTNESAKAR